MGQYFKVVNKSKRQVMCPHKFGSGAKLMEFTSDGMSVMQGLGILLADGNNRGGGDLRSDNPIIGSSCVLNIKTTDTISYDEFINFDEREYKIRVNIVS